MTPGGACTSPILTDPGRAPRVLDGTDLSITGVAFADSGMLALGGSDGSLRSVAPVPARHAGDQGGGSPVAAVAASPTATGW